jgi:hypothetical protein
MSFLGRYRRVFSPLAGLISVPVREKDRKRCKLVMTLLARDEEDIIRENMEFHLAQGVDFIIATDNASLDGTPDILREYEKKGVLYLLRETGQDFSQSHWVNRMGELAWNKFGANIIFHCDADEFWQPAGGNLKDELLRYPCVDVLTEIKVRNIVLEDKGGLERFPEDAIYCIARPYRTENPQNDSLHRPFYLYPYPGKVIFKSRGELPRVGMGNHKLANRKKFTFKASREIIIHHYPVRSKAHFYRKVINGGAALERNDKLNEKCGYLWRRWYKAYKDGRLDEEYAKLVLKRALADELIKEGVVELIPSNAH